MSKFWTVLSHTYTTRLKSKTFIITTVITALLVFGLANVQQIISFFNNGKPDKVAVLDQSRNLYKPLAAQIQKSDDDLKLIHYKKDEKQAQKAVQNGDFKGYLILSLNEKGIPEGTYKAEKISDEDISKKLNKALQQVKSAKVTQQLGLNSEQIASIYKPVTFHKAALKKGAKTEKELNQARTLVYALLFLIFFSVTMYGSMIAMEIATEKSSRVMEILISSVSPVKQMFGKILGVACLSLTQYAVLGLVGYFSLKSTSNDNSGPGDFFSALSLDAVPVTTVIYAVIFFILGYLLYATLFAMLGSLVSRTEDTQQLMAPVTLGVLAGFYIAIFGLGSPESPLVITTSFIPFFSPMIMFLRVGLETIPFWQTALSIAILIATISLFVWIGTRVYRGGVLMYGKASWKSIKHALVLSKTEK